MHLGTKLPSLGGATARLGPIAPPASLQGRVVVVNFWTYTCINWLRSLPSLRAWDRSYRENGLSIIGVHTPEFPFEHDIDNVRRAVKNMGIDYPVAVDNDYAVWHEFDNHYWPATYIFDEQGLLQHYHYGEGGYDESEMMIQRLLADAGARGVSGEPAEVAERGIEVAADWDNLKSAENYLGYARAQNFVTAGVRLDTPHRYSSPEQLRLNYWALSGDWVVTQQSIALAEADGHISYGFHARDVNLVMGPNTIGSQVRFRVSVDGQPPGVGHGVDTDSAGRGIVKDQRLYQLVRQSGPITDRLLEIEFLDPGVEAWAFTFG